MKDYLNLWVTLKGQMDWLRTQGNTPLTPLVVSMLMDNLEQVDDLETVQRDLQARLNELDAERRAG